MKKLIAIVLLLAASQSNAAPASPGWSAEATTGAAMGYCLAKHPYWTIHTGSYTPDGFEIVAPPGIVGAVRRNFIYNRTSAKDQGAANSCKRACGEFGKLYGPSLKGFALKQQVASGTPVPSLIPSGVGDMAALAMPDTDYYQSTKVTAGIWSRGNTFHTSDVAQADYCCCQVK